MPLGIDMVGENADLNSENIFEQPSKPPRYRSELSDPQLWNRRDQLVQTFEGSWSRLGRELPRVKRAEDLAEIFGPLRQGYISDTISVYCRPSSQAPSAKKLRELRSELRKVMEPWLGAERAKTHALEQLQVAEAAGVKSAVKGRRKEAAGAVGGYRDLNRTRIQLEAQIRELEPSFARHELFRFLKSERYEITPESLANATAGLPYMGWRQSMRRCKRAKSLTANGGAIQIFKAIRYLVGIAPDKTEKPLVGHFRSQIPSLPNRYKLPKSDLAEKWLFLERAIRKACRAKPHPKVLHFEITERYFAQLGAFSAQDGALAVQHRLILSNKRHRDVH